MVADYANFQKEFNFMKSSLEDLSRQVMLQQFFVEERIRTDGSSGLKQVCINRLGFGLNCPLRQYFSQSVLCHLSERVERE